MTQSINAATEAINIKSNHNKSFLDGQTVYVYDDKFDRNRQTDRRTNGDKEKDGWTEEKTGSN